jgi:hypothetical protein
MDRKDARRLTRRETLKRGAALGGALIWSVPTVQTLTMSAARAQTPSPSPGPDISYIALNVTCTHPVTASYVIKYEGCTGDDCFESDPGRFPACDGQFEPEGEKTDGDELGFDVTGPDPTTRCVEIVVPLGCTVHESAVKGAQLCCEGPTGTGTLEFCPPDC